MNYNDIEKLRERAENKKWSYHDETDEREKIIDEFEKTVRKLNSDELQKVRKMYNEMLEIGIKLNVTHIPSILKLNEKLNKRKENCNHEDNSCEVEKRGCEGCAYEKEPIIKRIELDER